MAETEQVRVTFEDDGSAQGIAQGLVDALDQVFTRATRALGDRLEKPFKDMASSAKKAGRSTDDVFTKIQASMRKTATQADAFAKTMQGIRTTSARTGGVLDPRTFDAAGQSFNQLDNQTERLITSFQQLVAVGGATDRTLENITAALRSQANIATTTQQSMSRLAATQADREAAIAREGERRQTALAVAGSKERIVAAQQEGAQSLAATRAAAQRRVEVFRAAIAQIRALERGLGTVFSTTARALGTAFSGVGRTISSALSRSNREMTSGLQSSLTTRTNILTRSFRSQEQVISSSIQRQSATLNNFEKQFSSGVAGFATGRSAAANALGFGGAALGGLGLFNVLKSGLTAGADFTAGLAVLDAQLQLTDEQMASVRQTALDLGNDISLPGVSALDAAQAIQQLAKQFGNLGVEAPAAATAAAKGVLQLSRATGAASEDAAQVVGAAINVFNVEAAEAVLVADQVANALSKAAGTSFVDFSAAFKQGATVFAQFQVPALGAKDALLEFNTALAVLAQGGLVGSDAGTSLRSFFLQANRGTKDTISVLNEISERAGITGTAFFEADGSARGLGETLEILRKGLEGLSDEQRTETLFKLFGSDAVRAAEILTTTTGPAFDQMRDSLRREGTAAALAAAQNQGLRGAMDALGSTIETQLILAYESFNVAAGNAVLVVANFVNNLASADGVFANIRTALKGIAVALGGLVGLKAIFEGFGFLRVAIGALLTPFGLLVAGATALGAGFALLMEHSVPFREAITTIGDRLQTLAGGALEFARAKLVEFGDFLGDTVVPALIRFGDFIGENILPALEALGSFIQTQVVPRLKTFATFFTDTLLPAVRDTAIDGFNALREGVENFARIVGPVLEPVVDVFERLGASLVNLVKTNPREFFTTLGGAVAGGLAGFAVGGPLGGLIGAAGGGLGALFAQGFGDEIVGGLQGIGSTILDALQSGLRSAGGFLKRVFTVDNALDLGLFATELAQRLGRVLGNVLSDPRLVAGAAGLAGIAALAAARFVIGFGQGVLSNVPELASMLGDALQAALKAAFNALTDLSAGTLVTALAGLFIGSTALRAFRGAGVKAGTEVKTGMLSAFARGSFGGAFAGGGALPSARGSFFTALFGGPDAISRQLATGVANATRTAQAEISRMKGILGRAGRPVLAGVDDRIIRNQFRQLSADIGPSGMLGLRLRSGLQATVQSLRTVSLAPLKSFFTDFGITARQGITAALKGLGTAAAGGFAGFQTGKALGGAGLLEGLLGVGGMALALGSINPLMGAAAGAAGLLGLALGRAGEAAKKAAAEIAEYRDALIGLTGAEVGESATAVFFENLKDESDGVADILADVSFDVGKFVQSIIDGTGSGADAFRDIVSEMGSEGEEFAAFLEGLGPMSAKAFETVLKETSQGQKFADFLKSINVDSGDLVDTFDLLNDESNELNTSLARVADDNALRQIAEDAGATEEQVRALVTALATMGAVDSAITALQVEAVRLEAEDAQLALDNARIAADDFLNGDYGDTLQSAIDNIFVNLPSVESQLAGLGELPTAVAEATRRQLGDRISVDLRAAVRVGLETGEITNPAEYLASLRTLIQAQIDTGQIPATAGAAVIAEIDSLLASPTFAADMASLLQSIVDNGVPPTVPAPFTLKPIVDAVDTSTLAGDISAALGSGNTSNSNQYGFSGGGGGGIGSAQLIQVPVTLDPDIKLAGGAATNAQAVGESISKFIAQGVASGASSVAVAAGQAAQLGVIAATITATAASRAGIVFATQFAAGIRSGMGAVAGAARALGAAASANVRTSTSAAFSAGVNVAQGLAAGIRSGQGAAISAARAMANAVASIVRAALQISSPSKVFVDIGRQIGAGLAQGIADSEGDISSAASSAVDAVVKASTTRADQIAAASAELFDLLAPGGANGVSAVDQTRSILGLSTIVTDLQEVFDKAAVDLWNAVAEPTTAQQRGIRAQFVNQGLGWTTLNTGAILGAQNAAGFLDIAERISAFMRDQLAAGADVRQVTATARGYVQQLRDVSAQYGTSGAEVESLLASLGLTDAAMNNLVGEVDRLRAEASKTVPKTPDPEEAKRETERLADEQKKRDEEAKEREEKNQALMLELLRIAVAKPTSVEVSIPYGDPEAVALATMNRIADSLSV